MDKKVINGIYAALILSFVGIVGYLVLSDTTNLTRAIAGKNLQVVQGTVTDVLIVQPVSGPTFQILTLSNGKRYRLKPEHEKGIGKGFNVELKLAKKRKNDANEEVHVLYKDTILVDKVRIIAIPIPGSSNKLKYPVTNPPIILKGKEK